MFLSKKKLVVVGMLFCAVALYAQSASNAQAAARDALARLDAALAGKTTAGTSQSAAPAQSSRGGAEPAWVIDPYRAYSRERYIAAVGFAQNRAEAEKKALAALTAIFGQSVQADFSSVTMYTEAVSKGIINASESTSARDAVATAASLDNLIGAEIGNIWDDGRNMVYAAAYMDREKTIAAYGEIVRTNLRNIVELTSMTAAEKNTFDGHSRYKLASVIAGLNVRYAQVLAQAGGPSASSLNLPSAESFNLEAQNIVKNITIAVKVEGDKSNRLRDAFAKAVAGAGLRTQGNNPPYTLEVSLTMNQATFPNNPNTFCRYSLSANLIEKATGSVLVPFTAADRSGGPSYEVAEAFAVNAVEKTINEKYPPALKEYLEALLPKK